MTAKVTCPVCGKVLRTQPRRDLANRLIARLPVHKRQDNPEKLCIGSGENVPVQE